MRLIVSVLLLLWASLPAAAHSSLVAVDPPDGSILPSVPPSVQLRFNEPISPAVIRLVDAAGHNRDDMTFTAHDDTISISVPHDLPRGTQVVSYRIISADGHPVSGSILFSVGVQSGSGATNTSVN